MRRIDERIESIRRDVLQKHNLSRNAVELSLKAVKGDNFHMRG